MTAAVGATKPAAKLPFGLNYLWDPKASLAIGAITSGSFVRKILLDRSHRTWRSGSPTALAKRGCGAHWDVQT